MIPKYPYYSSKTVCEEQPITFPPQHQPRQPGLQMLMVPPPISENPAYVGSGKLKDKVAILTGGDSGIGRATAIAFAKEGADLAIVYLFEHEDAQATKRRVEELGRRCLLIPGDLRQEAFCRAVIHHTLQQFGKIDILVLNQAVQYPQGQGIEAITTEQLHQTYATNIFPHFYMTKAALPFLRSGSTIISTASITAYAGAPLLIDYSSTKGAIVSFTRSLALSLVDRGIRVNAVAPGPIWTPLIPSSYSAEYVSTFGLETPMKRAGQPFELAPVYVFLASDDSSFVTGQTIHVNGGAMITS
ncbi:SDR family oxidoreductase [Paenibacillus rhizolycopersici]|uniref:SDR family oxidoreductase n=1 Tax=Paenibacillus rhizolycopersici TaxID=2780073 RepID=UPI003D2C2D10